MSKGNLVGQATPEQIKEWKEKHSDIFAVTVAAHVCYLKKPTRKDLSYASTAGKTDPLKFNEVILRNCWLGGSEEIRTEDNLFMGACGVLDKLIEIEEAEIKKL
ncbi:MAG: hypothetical protein LUE98_07765 [Tannerellaceae bacterium]|nr:hypothetical protein [Tannerellaceae bacterium]